MNAYTIDINGRKAEATPANGCDFTLLELQTLVGGRTKCYVERVYLNREEMMFCDEDGLSKALDYNAVASKLAQTRIVGKVLVCKQNMVN
jgi:hypothetical protein